MASVKFVVTVELEDERLGGTPLVRRFEFSELSRTTIELAPWTNAFVPHLLTPPNVAVPKAALIRTNRTVRLITSTNVPIVTLNPGSFLLVADGALADIFATHDDPDHGVSLDLFIVGDAA